MEKITDESLKEKYGEVKFLDMIDAFQEEASDAKQMEAGYWSEEDDVGVLQDVGFTKEEARYLVYDEQPQDEKEEEIIITRPGLSLANAGETLLEIRALAKKGYERDEDGEVKEYDDLIGLLDEIDIKASEALGLDW